MKWKDYIKKYKKKERLGENEQKKQRLDEKIIETVKRKKEKRKGVKREN